MSKKKTIYSNNTVSSTNGSCLTTVTLCATSSSVTLCATSSSVTLCATSSSVTYISPGYGYVTSGYYSIAEKCKYHIMGEDIEFNQSSDPYVAINISILNTMGWKYYEELKKNNVQFNTDVDYTLERMYKSWLRESKIDNILENKNN